ncbi:MAG: hypothetical protein JNL21_31345 [Myxococcales bacterium]|nr:hypothetical protein [Myxococcales bacterium]
MQIRRLLLPLLGLVACAKPAGDGAAASSSTSTQSSAATSGSNTTTGSTADRSIALTIRPPAAGDKRATRKRAEEAMTVGMRGTKGGIDVRTSKIVSTEKTETCLEVKDKTCIKLEVEIKRDNVDETTTTQLVDLEGKPDPKDKPKTKKKGGDNPTTGVVYIVAKDGKKPVVTRKDGKKPSKAELALVEKAYDDDPSLTAELESAYPKAVKVGDSLDAFAKALAKVIAGKSKDVTVVSSSVRVKEIRPTGKRALVVLDIDVSLESSTKELKELKTRSRGTIEIWADGGDEHASAITTELDGKFRKDGSVNGKFVETTERTDDSALGAGAP